MAYIKGKFETLGSNFSHETAGLLASHATIKKSILLTYFHISSVQIETTSYSVTMRFAFAKLLAAIMLHSEKSIIINVP